MKFVNCLGYSFIIALILVALYFIFKKIKEQNEDLTNEINNEETNNEQIKEETEDVDVNSLKQEEIKIKPEFEENGIMESGYDIILPENTEDFKNFKNIENEETEDLSDKYNKEVKKIKESDNYFINLGDIDGSLRFSEQSKICGGKQYPVKFNLENKKRILDNKKNYMKSTPYVGGYGNNNYGFTCVDKEVGKFLECRGNNGCKTE